MDRLMSFNLGCRRQAILVCLCLSATAASSRGGFDIINDDVVNKWKAYELFARSLQGTARQTITLDSGNTEHRLYTYKQNRECVMEMISKDQAVTEIFRIGNPRYAASIKTRNSDPSRATLDKITLSPNDSFPGNAGEHVSIFDLTRSAISPHFSIRNVPLSQIFHTPSIAILNASKVSENGRELIRMDYRYSYNDSTIGFEKKLRGSVFFDPSQCWCIRRHKTSATTTRKGAPFSDGEGEIEFETIEHASGYPLVKTQIQHSNSHKFNIEKRRVATTRIEYHWQVNDNVPDSAFALTAFGLPEPMGVEPLPPSRTWLWLVVAAVVATLAAMMFAWLKRRHTKTRSRTSTAS